MVLDANERDSLGQEGIDTSELSDDQASLSLRDADEETDVESVMMVRF